MFALFVVIHAAAFATIALQTAAGVAVVFAERYRAAAPVTCGAAMDVPLNVAVPEPVYVDKMFKPGALMSTMLP